jgi:hypothetical protein
MLTPAERVATDPDLRRVLEAARSWGVSPSVFLGRELNTRHVLDAADRAVASTTEAAWTDEDRALAVALGDYESQLCGGCGQPLAETTLAENEERYDVRVSARCHCCTAIDIAETAAQKMPHPGALMLSARLRPDQGEETDETDVST